MTSARITDEDIQTVFELFDTDASGVIDKDELLCALKALGWTRATRADALKIITSIDKDENGSVDLEEFKQIVRDRSKKAGSDEEVTAVFRLFDIESKGRLTVDNLRVIGERVTGHEVSDSYLADLMAAIDVNQDGVIDLEEFKAAVAPAEIKKRVFVEGHEGRDSSEKPMATNEVKEDPSVHAEALAVPDEHVEADEEHHDQVETSNEEVVENAEEEVIEEEQPSGPLTHEIIAGVDVDYDSGDGLISKQGVRKVLVSLGYDYDGDLSEDDFTALFQSYDQDEDDVVSRHELCQLLVAMGETVDGY